jgi:hypothetical protein
MINSRQLSNKIEYSNVQPVWKFYFLHIMTWGIYEIAWSYKHWKFIKERENSKINLWMRSIWLPFTLYWLAKKMFLLAEEKGSKTKYSPTAIAIFYWFVLILPFNLPDALSFILVFFSALPLLRVLRSANYFWEQEQPNLPIRQTWTGGEVAWIVSGIFLWLWNIYSFLMPANN